MRTIGEKGTQTGSEGEGEEGQTAENWLFRALAVEWWAVGEHVIEVTFVTGACSGDGSILFSLKATQQSV